MKEGAHTTTRLPARLATALACVLAIAALPAAAQAQWGGEFRGQMGFGGDKLGTVTYSDGSESTLRLGTYITLSIGPSFELWSSGASALELQGMVGWSTWGTGPENTDDRLKLSHFPVEALAFYRHRLPIKDWVLRVGGGAIYQIGGGVSGSGSLEGNEVDIDNALGGAGEVSVVSGILSFGVRYTRVSPVVDGATMDGSSIGVYFGLVTPR